VTQADETAYEDDNGPDGGADVDLDGPDDDFNAVDDDLDDAPEEGNRALAPVANAVLGHITRSIVDDPDAVEVETIALRPGKVRLAVRVAPNDFGRLIGRRGRVAAAVRTLVSAAAVRDGLDVEVEFVE
jgi:predicted RNA-binding protein YlqC (UPF0109 family)